MQFIDNRKVMMVNISDFFLYVFEELIDPKSDLFMYNDNKTLAWFPPKVNVLDDPHFNPFIANPKPAVLMFPFKCP